MPLVLCRKRCGTRSGQHERERWGEKWVKKKQRKEWRLKGVWMGRSAARWRGCASPRRGRGRGAALRWRGAADAARRRGDRGLGRRRDLGRREHLLHPGVLRHGRERRRRVEQPPALALCAACHLSKVTVLREGPREKKTRRNEKGDSQTKNGLCDGKTEGNRSSGGFWCGCCVFVPLVLMPV